MRRRCLACAAGGACELRLLKFYRQKFWGNLAVFKAAQALAKRAVNVVRRFIVLSNGGVGQFLYSAHLRAMYARNFPYFDPISGTTMKRCESR